MVSMFKTLTQPGIVADVKIRFVVANGIRKVWLPVFFMKCAGPRAQKLMKSSAATLNRRASR